VDKAHASPKQGEEGKEMRSWVTEKEVLGKVEHYKKAGLWELEQERIKLWKVRHYGRARVSDLHTGTR
jgi:hypothetical protein